ncbi:chaperone modulator CbpM [Shinella fusca]|uniref:Chaperone modulatory protein CbpM n=2 Tax=Shinella fusca TaxID=544480 RepID=A0A7W7YTZ8_9HYPH|nr:chaperone modulator CbpM [Shinella fusca]MBB5042355.1 chaperone modulatory protein CbpM [Shinella fusca]
MRMDKQTFLKTSGLQVKVLELWIEQEWLVPQQTASGVFFEEIDVARVRLIRELQSRIGANDAGIDVILHLMDQLHGMRRAMAELRRDMGGPQA